jgi:hypothetical protein
VTCGSHVLPIRGPTLASWGKQEACKGRLSHMGRRYQGEGTTVTTHTAALIAALDRAVHLTVNVDSVSDRWSTLISPYPLSPHSTMLPKLYGGRFVHRFCGDTRGP